MKSETKTRTSKWMLCAFLLLGLVLTIVFATHTFGSLDYCSEGLLLNLIGIVISFLFAFSNPIYVDGIGVGLEDGTEISFEGRKITVAEFLKIEREKAKVHKWWSILGVVYLIAGTVFQLFH